MSNTEWKEYYDRWSNRISSIENRSDVIGKVIYKYGDIQAVAKIMTFDCLYEYAKRYGKNVYNSNDDLDDILVEEYDTDGYRIQLFYTEHSVIKIIKL